MGHGKMGDLATLCAGLTGSSTANHLAPRAWCYHFQVDMIIETCIRAILCA